METQERLDLDALRIELLDRIGSVEAKLDALREEMAALTRLILRKGVSE
jgi:hypothetical protein